MLILTRRPGESVKIGDERLANVSQGISAGFSVAGVHRQ